MRCPQCHCDNSETVTRCPGCGQATAASLDFLADAGLLAPGRQPFQSQTLAIESPIEVLGYATMGERFLAFLCDASIETLLIGIFLATFYLRSSLGFERLKQIAVWIIPTAYMTLSEFFFHGTIGKRLLRIQLLDDSPGCKYPTLGRILRRESLGKFLSGLALGMGFLVAVDNPQKKTWADRMARTIVVRTGIVRPPVKALLVVILIFSYFGFAIALKTIPATYRSNLENQRRADEVKIEDLQVRIFQTVFFRKPKSIQEYQQAISSLSPVLDEYGRLLCEEQELGSRSRKLMVSGYKFDSDLYDVYEQVIVLRKEIAQLVRSHVQTVVAFDPRTQTWAEILQARSELRRQIYARNNRINQIGKGFIPTIEFQCQDC